MKRKTPWILAACAAAGLAAGFFGLSPAWGENYKTWDAQRRQWVEVSGRPVTPVRPWVADSDSASGSEAPVPVSAPAPPPAPKWQVTIVTNEWHYCSPLNNFLFGAQAPYGCYYAYPPYGYGSSAYLYLGGRIGGHHHHH